MGLRVATADDWRAVVGQDAPAHWIGLVYEENGEALGIGGAYEGQDGRWWASIKAGARRPVALMKAAREILDTAGSARVPLYAIADQSIEKSEKLLIKLGFQLTDESHAGHKVYRWTP